MRGTPTESTVTVPAAGSQHGQARHLDGLRRRSIATLLGEGTLQPLEVKALVDAMTVPEMVTAMARIDKKRQSADVAAVPLIAGALSATEANALVHALSPAELQRTIERAGLAQPAEQLDAKQQRRRASVALMHPLPVPDEEKHAADAVGRVQVRVDVLKQLARAGASDETAPAKGDGAPPPMVSACSSDDWLDAIYNDEVDPLELIRQAAAGRTPSVVSVGTEGVDDDDGGGGADSPATLVFGGVAFSPDFLDEFMLTPGEFDERLTHEEWGEQLLLMYNVISPLIMEPNAPRRPPSCTPEKPLMIVRIHALLCS